ncbi:MAG: RNA polymerase sigma factor [Bryobacterales bacterium]|nr:RNA polymerase sigma factor [Bryobacterales bacterium]
MPDRESPPVADLDLLQRTAAGDRDAFTAFVERHQAAVFRHACCLAHSRADAEDVLQETFLSALKSAGQFRGEASGRTWLLQIARRAAWRRLKHTTEGEEEATLESLAFTAGWGAQNPESLAMLAEDRRLLEAALAALPAPEREILLLREWDGRPGEETAAALGLSLTAMKSRLHRARLHLAALLRETRSTKT